MSEAPKLLPEGPQMMRIFVFNRTCSRCPEPALNFYAGVDPDGELFAGSLCDVHATALLEHLRDTMVMYGTGTFIADEVRVAAGLALEPHESVS